MGKYFGTDGVRGVANKELTPELAFKLGRCGGYVLTKDAEKPKVLIGRDTRVSGFMLEGALIAGLMSIGAEVMRLGVITTPGVAYLTKATSSQAGVMISASHNPVEDNGIKFFGPDGFKLLDEQEEEIERLMDAVEDHLPRPTGANLGIANDYFEGGQKYLSFLKDLKHFNTSETIEALNFWTDFVKDGYTPKSVLNWTENDVATQFINGKFPMFQGGSWIIPIMEKEDINYDIIPLPTPEKGGDSMGPIGGEVMVIGKNSKNEKAAWDFIAWTQDEEVLNPINETFGYLPAYLPAQEKYLKEHPKFESVAETLKHGKSRTAVVGIDYPEISKELWKGIQNVITGENTSDEIVKQIQDKVDNLSD